MSETREVTIGFIVNPIAGMGGRVGLKGTDGAEVLDEARRRGAKPLAGERALKALVRVRKSPLRIRLLSGQGSMGEDIARTAGFKPLTASFAQPHVTTAQDTQTTAKWMTANAADIILFVGGDGTARDIFEAVGNQIPMLGVPAGVKMHSAVFGTSPQNAGHLAALFIERNPTAVLRAAEVMDLDEAAIRQDRVSAHLYGYASSPYERLLAQNAKSGSQPGEEASLDAVARQIVARMKPGCLYILGPGTTTRRVALALGVRSTLLGVDAIQDGNVVGADLDEERLLRLMEGRDSYLVVGVLGGQGSLFGRGNQQISADVIRKVGRDKIIVLSTMDKLVSLQSAPLRVDTGVTEVDAMLTGHIRVEVGHQRSAVFKVQA